MSSLIKCFTTHNAALEKSLSVDEFLTIENHVKSYREKGIEGADLSKIRQNVIGVIENLVSGVDAEIQDIFKQVPNSYDLWNLGQHVLTKEYEIKETGQKIIATITAQRAYENAVEKKTTLSNLLGCFNA